MSIADDIVSLIRAHRFDLSSEDALQQGLAQVLSGSSFKHQREVALTKADRIDFMVEGCGIEVKVDGGALAALRQLHRYAQHRDVKSLLLVTTRASHVGQLPTTMNEKPVQAVVLYGAFS